MSKAGSNETALKFNRKEQKIMRAVRLKAMERLENMCSIAIKKFKKSGIQDFNLVVYFRR
ncbi:MAG: hypothetical protein CR988_00010 [Treponema sp.]|nr:MAG: hypothetical protein CR988_00010 [Treponema sp.]